METHLSPGFKWTPPPKQCFFLKKPVLSLHLSEAIHFQVLYSKPKKWFISPSPYTHMIWSSSSSSSNLHPMFFFWIEDFDSRHACSFFFFYCFFCWSWFTLPYDHGLFLFWLLCDDVRCSQAWKHLICFAPLDHYKYPLCKPKELDWTVLYKRVEACLSFFFFLTKHPTSQQIPIPDFWSKKKPERDERNWEDL